MRAVGIPVARRHRGVVAPVLGFLALGIAALVAVGLESTEIGLLGVVVGALCALLPVGPVVAVFLWVDRYEPEPPRLLLAAFGWGAGVAALVAIVLNSSAVLAAQALLGRGGDAVGPLVSAPLVEEAVKGAFLVGLLLVRRREFDGVVDGVVYAGVTAAGFAFTENILYFGRAFLSVGGGLPATAVATTFLFRGLLSPFAHPLFTAMTGIGVGIAASVRSRFAGTVAIVVGYAVAVALHALWNAATQLGPGFFGIYLLVMVPLFGVLTGLVVWQRRRERAVLAAQMPGFAAAGWIAPSEVELLSSIHGRRRWRAAVRRRAGRGAAHRVVDYQHAVTELAFLRARAAAGALEARADWHAELLDAVARTRHAAVAAPAGGR